jgi:endonuclease/exonuclease/phosphatase family metal-dependent hydrolase
MKIRVMSFNWRYDKPDLGNFAGKVRKEAVASVINAYAPDLIGTQEGLAHQILDLHRLLPDYQTVGADLTDTGIVEHCAIF